MLLSNIFNQVKQPYGIALWRSTLHEFHLIARFEVGNGVEIELLDAEF